METQKETTKKMSITAKDIIIVILIVAILAATLAVVSSSLDKNMAAQEKLQAELDKLTQQIENQKNPTIEELEAKIAAAIAGIKLPEGVTAEEVNKAIKDAIDGIKMPEGGLTAAQVEKIVADAIAKIKLPEAGLTAEEIEKIINDAIAGIKHPETGLTVEQVQKLIADSIAAIQHPQGLTEAQVKKLIAEALAELKFELTEEQIQEIVDRVLAALDNKPEQPEEPEQPELPEETIEVDSSKAFADAIVNEDVNEIILTGDIKLESALTINKDVVIDLNGFKLTGAKNIVYPDAVILTVTDSSEVTIKNGSIASTGVKLNGDMIFIRVARGSSLNLDKVSVNIQVIPEVFYNNTISKWQMNTAEHSIFSMSDNANVTLNDSNINVVAPEVPNVPDYRRAMTIVGVKFVKNTDNATFVMNGGSFSLKVTEPLATDITDTLYFIKSSRTNTDATNKVTIGGNAKITVGGPNYAGDINSTNYPYVAVMNWDGSSNVYSGIESFKLSAGTSFSVSGVSYTLKTTKEYITENATKNLIGLIKDDCDVVEEKFHFVCSDKAFGCNHEMDLTIKEMKAQKEAWGTIKVSGYDIRLLNCPYCTYGGYVLSNP